MPNASPGRGCSRRQLLVGRVFVVEVVLADVDDGQLPQRRHVHDLVDQALAERAVAEEADRDLVRAAHLGRQGRAGRDAGAAADDRVRAEVAGVLVGDVHRAAFAPAVARRLAQQLGKHAVDRRAFGQAMAVAAVRAGDVSSRRSASQTPTAMASSPMYRCASPGICRLLYSSLTSSSNRRMLSICSYRCSHCSTSSACTPKPGATPGVDAP